jgi:hypothetical protein
MLGECLLRAARRRAERWPAAGRTGPPGVLRRLVPVDCDPPAPAARDLRAAAHRRWASPPGNEPEEPRR